MGAGYPKAFASILRTQNAALARQEKSRVLASAQRGLKFMDVTATVRRLFGSCGGADRQDMLGTADAHGPLGRETEQEACATYKKAKTRSGSQNDGGMRQCGERQSDRGWSNMEWIQPHYGSTESVLHM